MPEEEQSRAAPEPGRKGRGRGGPGGEIVYALGVVGALVYYIQTATGLGDGALGVLKALVWPAMLVFKSLQFLQA